MHKKLLALALSGAFALPVMAEEASPLSFNVGVVSDYVFRGISQSQHQPALQGGVDYAHGSGFYVGLWGSQVEWTDRKDLRVQKGNNIEVDLYGGYKKTLGDFGLDVGAIRYYYPGDFNPAAGVTANTSEAYVGGSWKFLTLKYNYVISSSIFNWGGTTNNTRSKGSEYIDLTATYPVNDTVNLIGHLGRQNIKNDQNNGGQWSYSDWKVGATKDFGFGVVGLSYTGTNAKFNKNLVSTNYNWAGKDVGKDVIALSFLKTF